MVNLLVVKKFTPVEIVVQVTLKCQEQIILEKEDKMEGVVKFFKEEKGFGFIEVEGEKDYFVHISAIENQEALKEGDKVSFDAEQDDRGEKAVNVKVLSADSEE